MLVLDLIRQHLFLSVNFDEFFFLSLKLIVRLTKSDFKVFKY